MGFLSDIGGKMGDFKDWLMEPGKGPTSDVEKPDRNNFNLPGAEQRGNNLNQLAAGYGNRNAPQSQSYTAADSSFRNDQQQLVNRLRNQMSGADSLSEMQFRRANDANVAQQRSMAASAGPQNSAMMQRAAMQNIGRMGQGFGAQASQLGIQERNAAANALGGVAGQGRQQDIGLNQFNAGQQQQGSQFNVGAQLQQTGMNDQAAAAARQQELANAELQQRGSMGFESNNTQRYGIDKGVPVQPAGWEKLVGAAGALAPLAMLSDERAKTNEHAMGSDADHLISKLKGYTFDYKGGGPHNRVGVMAQDVQSGGPMGRSMVHDQGGMKAIDMPQAVGTALGLVGRLGERLDHLEGKPRMMADGGVVTQPTDAIVGEAGPEAVLPLSALTQPQAPHPDWSFSKIGEAPGETHETRDAMIHAAQASEDPLTKGLAGITQAAAMYADKKAAKTKEKKEIQQPLANFANRKDPQVRDLASRGTMSHGADRRPEGMGSYFGGMSGGASFKPDGTGPESQLLGLLGGSGSTQMYRMMASGGVVTRPTRAIIGESGPEVVVPLDELPSLVQRIAARTKQTADSGSRRYTPPVERPEELYRERVVIPPERQRSEELYRERKEVPRGYRPLPVPHISR